LEGWGQKEGFLKLVLLNLEEFGTERKEGRFPKLRLELEGYKKGGPLVGRNWLGALEGLSIKF